MSTYKIDPKLDLVLERTIDLPVEKVWEAWTTPAHLKNFFVPKPWSVADVKIDLKVGGTFHTVMRGPEGQEFPAGGCYLEIVKNEKLVWTDAMTEGFRPSANPFFTAHLTLEKVGPNQTKYTAIAIHGTEENKKKHEEMGFTQGLGIVLDQLVTYMKGL